MPLEAIASAVARIVASDTLQANLFQLIQPNGGVCASPFALRLGSSEGGRWLGAISCAIAAAGRSKASKATIQRDIFPLLGVSVVFGGVVLFVWVGLCFGVCFCFL